MSRGTHTPAVLALSALLLLPLARSAAEAGGADSARAMPPGRLLFPVLIAHHVEARMGAVSLVGEERLRLDIGNAVDLWDASWESGRHTVAVGAEFFTWTSLRREKDFHFPVDAVDYLFGVNASWRHAVNGDWTASARFRLSHISAHLADGSYDKTAARWRDDQLPRVYSREFFDLVGAVEWTEALRLYLGAQYIYHVDPSDLGTFGVQAGVEAAWVEGPADGVTPYVAYDLRTVDMTAVTAAHGAQIGVKFGTWRGRGVNLFVALYHGVSQHGEYFDRHWSYWGPGFTVDF
ncbi:MAG TPA: DUF1207 domain-containing protein [Bacteroidota bacterium]|nr:DUF1207 domain-containing protein [Bacteroidota bacterium]